MSFSIDQSLSELAPFSVQTECFGMTCEVAVEGELELASVDRLDTAVSRLLERAPEVLLLDLSATTFVDSTGMRSVLSAERRATRHGVRVHIIPAAPSVHRIFALCGLDAVLPFLPLAEAADPA